MTAHSAVPLASQDRRHQSLGRRFHFVSLLLLPFAFEVFVFQFALISSSTAVS
jgi:hypothetical protein